MIDLKPKELNSKSNLNKNNLINLIMDLVNKKLYDRRQTGEIVVKGVTFNSQMSLKLKKYSGTTFKNTSVYKRVL